MLTIKKTTLLSILFLMLGCGSIPDIHYYIIDYSIAPSNQGNSKYNFILGVETFAADPLYEEDRIVYRDSPYEVKFYNYHQWIIPPKEMVTAKVISHCASSNLFKQVVSFPHQSSVHFILRGTIKAFEEWDENTQWYAHTKIHFELLNREDNSLIWQETIAKKTAVDFKKPIEVVRTLGIGLDSCISEALSSIDKILLSYSNE